MGVRPSHGGAAARRVRRGAGGGGGGPARRRLPHFAGGAESGDVGPADGHRAAAAGDGPFGQRPGAGGGRPGGVPHAPFPAAFFRLRPAAAGGRRRAGLRGGAFESSVQQPALWRGKAGGERALPAPGQPGGAAFAGLGAGHPAPPPAAGPDPFAGAGSLPGLGLGLPLAAAFAARYGGAFTLESRPGKGVAAALSLPLCPVARLPRPPHAAALLADRYSPVYVQLSPRCVLPD